MLVVRHLIHTRLNYDFSFGRGRARDRDWLRRRVGLYLQYSTGSLARQTTSDFTVWLDCRPGSESDLEEFLPDIAGAGVRITFDGGRALLVEAFSHISHVLITRLDSDDMYAPDALEQIRSLHGDARASQFQRGYVYDEPTGRLFRVARRSPPFYTFRFARGEFESSHDFARWLPQRGGRRGHSVVWDMYAPAPLPDGRFCVVRHDMNSGPLGDCQPVVNDAALTEIARLFDLPRVTAAQRLPAGVG